MASSLKKLASEAEKSLSLTPDFSDTNPLSEACFNVLEYLEKYRIGPAVLSLLIAFAFPEASRERIWHGINRVVRESRDT